MDRGQLGSGWLRSHEKLRRDGGSRGRQRQARPGIPAAWRAGSNLIELGEFPTRDEAMDRIECDVRERMRRISEDWATFHAQPKRPLR